MTFLEAIKFFFTGKTPRDPNTWDYSNRYWGHDYTVIDVDGAKLRLTGWGSGLQKGDFIILRVVAGTTRYQLTDVSYYSDPHDMWKAEAKFAPR
jgi:hypothetical protein